MPGLSEARESIALSLRKTLYLPLDDRLYINRACIHAEGAHTGLAKLDFIHSGCVTDGLRQALE